MQATVKQGWFQSNTFCQGYISVDYISTRSTIYTYSRYQDVTKKLHVHKKVTVSAKLFSKFSTLDKMDFSIIYGSYIIFHFASLPNNLRYIHTRPFYILRRFTFYTTRQYIFMDQEIETDHIMVSVCQRLQFLYIRNRPPNGSNHYTIFILPKNGTYIFSKKNLTFQ